MIDGSLLASLLSVLTLVSPELWRIHRQARRPD